MLDARYVRESPDAVRKAMSDRGSAWSLDAFLELDEERRKLIGRVEKLQARRNEASKAIGRIMKEGPRTEAAESLKNEVRSINDELGGLEAVLETVEADTRDLLMTAPNLPDPGVPVGADETANPEVRRWGTPRTFDFEPKAHWDLGPELGIIDFERGVKLAKSRFVLMGGLGARLERALINLMLDTHTARGYKEWWPPILANAESLTGTGQLPKFEDDLFKTMTGGTPLYLVPTAEVALTNIHRDETLDVAALPLHYTAFTPCFREEAGAAGRDTRGMIRVHQFDKVELVKFAGPEDSMAAREHGGRRGRDPRASRAALPRHRPVYGRHGLQRGEDLRPRGLAAELRRLQGDLVLLELRGLPGASRVDPLPRSGRLQGDSPRSHAERVGTGGRPDGRRDHRELPERRRVSERARGLAAVHGCRRHHRGVGRGPGSRCVSDAGTILVSTLRGLPLG
jgi:seryl-tRNA synthetase